MRFLYFLIFISVVFLRLGAYAFNEGYPTPQVYQINSIFSERASFDAYYYPAPQSKGTVVYLYGGGCLFPGTDGMLELFEFGKKIIESGYSLYIPHYRQSLQWDTAHIPFDQVESICVPATLNQIADIKSSIVFLSEKLKEKIFLFGELHMGHF